jgi:hypothetical protein
MKKGILIVFALVLIATGLISAAAFEGHLVDVRAHVENALWVDPYELNYGNYSFPQESLDEYLCIGLTQSFLNNNQTRLCDVKYVLFWEPKPIAGHDPVPGQQEICDPDGDGNFTPIAPFILMTTADGSDGPVTAGSPGWAQVPGAVAFGTLDKCLPDNCDTWGLKFDVPVFDKWYNEGTDPLIPSGVLGPDEYCLVEEWVGCTQCDYRWVEVPHADLGSNLKIQVMGYSVAAPD